MGNGLMVLQWRNISTLMLYYTLIFALQKQSAWHCSGGSTQVFEGKVTNRVGCSEPANDSRTQASEDREEANQSGGGKCVGLYGPARTPPRRRACLRGEMPGQKQVPMKHLGLAQALGHIPP
uniref:Secreted protein n=1 Tax=Coccidioides posadasii RMSCC 3488 TaxID=454284 RepID=A0A0J6IAG9_COCPO|nr:hypothetical protein CPAG_04943 [Coccidioides posadasii RMSCC 3488]